MTNPKESRKAPQRRRLVSMLFISLSAALIAVCSYITIPAPVPFTLQVFGVAFALCFLGGARGTVAVLLYLSLGAIGLPVLAGSSVRDAVCSTLQFTRLRDSWGRDGMLPLMLLI